MNSIDSYQELNSNEEVSELIKTAKLYYDKKDYSNSLIIYKKIIKLKADSFEANYMIGKIYNLQKKDNCIVYLNKALEIYTNCAEAYYERGKY